MDNNNHKLSTYLVFGSSNLQTPQSGKNIEQTLRGFVKSILDSNIDVIQLREKDKNGNTLDSGVFFAHAKIISEEIKIRKSETLLIINDRIDVAIALYLAGVKVDGVHIGQTDLPAKIVRQMFNKIGWNNAIIGLSCRTELAIETATNLHKSGAIDYIGIGPLHTTQSKPNMPSGFEYENWEKLLNFAKTLDNTLPVLAIGGITPNDAHWLHKIGADGYCCITYITNAADPGKNAIEFVQAWSNS